MRAFNHRWTRIGADEAKTQNPRESVFICGPFFRLLKCRLLYSSQHLSDRELEVLRFIALGENSKTIALRFNISSKTVDTHCRNIMEKLKLYSVVELTKYAIREKIIQDGE